MVLRPLTQEEINKMGKIGLRKLTPEEQAKISAMTAGPPGIKPEEMAPELDIMRRLERAAQPFQGQEDISLGEITLSPDVEQQLVRPADVAGGYGAGLGFALGGPLGTIPGAFLTTLLATEGQDFLNRIAGVPELRTRRQRLGEAGIQGVMEGPQAILGKARKSAKTLKRMGLVTPEDEAALRLILDEGGKVPLDRVTNARFIDLLGGIAEGSFFGGGKYKKAIEETRSLINNALKRTSDEHMGVFLGNLETGSVIDASFGLSQKFAREVSNEVYSSIARSTEQLGIVGSLDPVLSALQREKRIALKTGAKNFGETPVGRILADVDDLVEQFPEGIPWTEIKDFRTRVGAEMASLQKGTPGFHAVKEAKKALTKEMRESILRTGDEALLKRVDDMNTLYHTFEERIWGEFSNRLKREVLTRNPESITNILRGNRVSDLQRVKDLFLNPPGPLPKDPKAWKALQRAAMEDGLKRIDRVGNIPTNMTPEEVFFRSTPEMVGTLLEPEIRKPIQSFLDAINRVQSVGLAGEGKMLVQLTQAGQLIMAGTALMGAMFGGELREEIALPAIGMIMLPWVVARMMVNPRSVRALTIGVNQPIGKTIRTGSYLRLLRSYQDALTQSIQEGDTILNRSEENAQR